MVGRKLKDLNSEEQNAFYNIFTSEEYKTDVYMEVIADKLYRHNYAYVGNDLVEQTVKLFEKCGLKLIVDIPDRIMTLIELA